MFDISVCIPVHNSEATIETAVNSIINQATSAKIEILICDDGSTDNTPRVLSELADKYCNIRILKNGTNLGRPRTRNYLLQEARGRYITWLDADDQKYTNMLDHQYSYLEKIRQSSEASLSGVLVFTNFHWLWPNMKTPILMCPPEAALHMEYLLNAKFGGYLWLMMGTKETFMTVGGFDENLPRLQDLDFFIRFCQKGGIFHKIGSDEAMCIYYKDDVSRGAMSVWKSWTHIWKKHRLLYYSFGYNNAFKWRHHHFRVARRFAKANRDWNTYIIVSTEELIFRVVKFIKINFCGRA